MKKRLLSILLAMIMCLNLFPASLAVEAESEASDFVIENGVLVEYNGPGGDVVIPNGVTAIGDSTFAKCHTISSVTIPYGVTSIGNDAFFQCSKLAEVSIPGSVTTIGNYAFSQCWSLTSFSIPEGVSKIGDNAFSYCGALTEVTLPNSLIAIGDSAFSGCKIEEISFPEGLRSIGKQAFVAVPLNAVCLPKGLETLGEEAFGRNDKLSSVTIGRVIETSRGAFSYCSNLTEVTLLEDLDSMDVSLIDYSLRPILYPNFQMTFSSNVKTGREAYLSKYIGTESHVKIPNGITWILNRAFENCVSVTAVSFPETLEEINGQYIFEGCTNLTEITIPNTVTKINWAVFADSSLKRVYLPAHLMDTYLSLPDGCAKICKDDKVEDDCVIHNGILLQYVGSGGRVIIPNSVTDIAENAFINNTTVTEVVIPASVNSIGNLAFYNCTELASVTIENGVTSIGSQAFACCTGLTSVSIPDSVISIEQGAFSSCSKLSSVILPSAVVANLSQEVFDWSTKVTLTNHIFRVEGGVLKQYTGPGGNIVIPEGVTSITWNMNIGRYSGELTGIVFPSSINTINEGTITNQYKLTDVTIPASVTSISDRAFLVNWFEMQGITVHGAAGSYAEAWAKKMGYAFLADQPWNVSSEASKHKFTVENGVLKAYEGPGGDIVVPDNVTSILYGVLDNIYMMTSLTLPGGIKEVTISNSDVKKIVIGSGATRVSLNCPALESVVIPDSVTSLSIVSDALRELTIPDGVTSLAITSNSLRELNIPNSITKWPALNCPRLRKLTFPKDNWVFKGISRSDFMSKIADYPALDEIINCPNEFVDDLIAPNVALRNNWKNPRTTLVAQSARITKLSNEITAGLTNDYDKAKAISQWVVDHIKYDNDYYYEGLKDYSDVPFDPEEILNKGQAVCAGFARLTQALLVAQKIPCLYVLGDTSAGYHAWNLALIDGEYMWIDNTWGMKYFGLGVYAISKNHQATGAASFNNVKGPGTLISGDSGNGNDTIDETEEERQVREKIEALRGSYPEGMQWTNSNSYYSSALNAWGNGCAGFAFICSDAVFGNAPVTKTHSHFDEIRVGDILRIDNDTHSVVVLRKLPDSVIVAEGNYNSSIHWNREISRESLEKGGLVVTTRWAQASPWDTASDWAKKEVEAAITAEIVPADIQNNYTTAITREEFCTMMVKMVETWSGQSMADYIKVKGLSYSLPFTDTQNRTVGYAYALGIINGRGEGIFDPYSSITRQEAAAMLTRAAKCLGVSSGSGMNFNDVKNLDSWAKEGISFVSGLTDPTSGNRVMGGVAPDTFDPWGTYTREQAILTALRLFNAAG